MSFGSTADSWLYEILFGLGALVAIVLLGLVGGLIRRILRIKVDYFTLLFVISGSVAITLGLSLYLDTVGQVATATVTKKLATVHYRDQGDWYQQYEVWANYALADGNIASTHFTTNVFLFDSMHEGSQVAVRSVSVNGWFNLVRFADQSTWTWIPWRWVEVGLGIIGAAFIAWRLFKIRGGWLFIVLFLLCLATVPFVRKYNEWRAAGDPNHTPLHASGIIQDIHEVDTIDPLPGDSSDGDEWETAMVVVQRYAIVVVRYTPAGYTEPILGVDAVDIDASTVPLLVDSPVDLSYAATDPHEVRLPGRTRNHHIRNPMAWLKEQLLAVGLLAAFLLALSWIGKRGQRFLTRRSTPLVPPIQ